LKNFSELGLILGFPLDKYEDAVLQSFLLKHGTWGQNILLVYLINTHRYAEANNLVQHIAESNEVDGHLRSSIIENLKEALPAAAFKTSEEILASVISEINLQLPKITVTQFINPAASPFVKKSNERNDIHKYASTPSESFAIKQMNSFYSLSPIKREFSTESHFEGDTYPAKSIQTFSKAKLGTDKIHQSSSLQESDYDMDGEDQHMDDHAAGVLYEEPQFRSNFSRAASQVQKHADTTDSHQHQQEMDYTSTLGRASERSNLKTPKRLEDSASSILSPTGIDQNPKTRPKIRAMPTQKTQTQLFKRV